MDRVEKRDSIIPQLLGGNGNGPAIPSPAPVPSLPGADEVGRLRAAVQTAVGELQKKITVLALAAQDKGVIGDDEVHALTAELDSNVSVDSVDALKNFILGGLGELQKRISVLALAAQDKGMISEDEGTALTEDISLEGGKDG
jgi:hypothetical protein